MFEVMDYTGKTVKIFYDYNNALEYVKQGKYYIWCKDKKRMIYDSFSGENEKEVKGGE